MDRKTVYDLTLEYFNGDTLAADVWVNKYCLKSVIDDQIEFKPDSFVLVKHRTGSPPTRLHTLWKGPLRVISYNKSHYLLWDLINNKEKTYHVTDLKQFHFDPLQTDPVDIARCDYLE